MKENERRLIMIYIFKNLGLESTFEQFYSEYKQFFGVDYTEKENEKSGLIKNQNDEYIRVNRKGDVEMWEDDGTNEKVVLIKDYCVYFDCCLRENGFIPDFYDIDETKKFIDFSDYDEYISELNKYAQENNLKKISFNEPSSDLFYAKDVEIVKDYLKESYYLLDDEVENNLKEY